MIWNAADQNAHNGATTADIAGDSAPGLLTCYSDTDKSKFGRRSTFAQNIADICKKVATNPGPDPALGNFVQGTYNQGQLQEAQLSYGFPDQGRVQEDKIHCNRMFGRIINECDNEDNPMGWGFGGEVDLDSTSYILKPLYGREPMVQAPTGSCTVEDPSPLPVGDASIIKIFGLGWEGSGLIDSIKATFGNQVLDDPPPVFTYNHQPDRDWDFSAYVGLNRDGSDLKKVGEIVTKAVDWDVSIPVGPDGCDDKRASPSASK